MKSFFLRIFIVTIVCLVIVVFLQRSTSKEKQQYKVELEQQQVLLQQLRILLVSSNQLDVSQISFVDTHAHINTQILSIIEKLNTPVTSTSWQYRLIHPIQSTHLLELQKDISTFVKAFNEHYNTVTAYEQNLQKIFTYSAVKDFQSLEPIQQKEVSQRAEATITGLTSIANQYPTLQSQIQIVQHELRKLQSSNFSTSQTYSQQVSKIDSAFQKLQLQTFQLRKNKVQELFVPILITHNDLMQHIAQVQQELQ